MAAARMMVHDVCGRVKCAMVRNVRGRVKRAMVRGVCGRVKCVMSAVRLRWQAVRMMSAVRLRWQAVRVMLDKKAMVCAMVRNVRGCVKRVCRQCGYDDGRCV